MIDMNRNFHQILTNKKAGHFYIESLGKHDTVYWSKSYQINWHFSQIIFRDERFLPLLFSTKVILKTGIALANINASLEVPFSVLFVILILNESIDIIQ